MIKTFYLQFRFNLFPILHLLIQDFYIPYLLHFLPPPLLPLINLTCQLIIIMKMILQYSHHIPHYLLPLLLPLQNLGRHNQSNFHPFLRQFLVKLLILSLLQNLRNPSTQDQSSTKLIIHPIQQQIFSTKKDAI
mmetsp:Transcript_11755/g.1807  ORF Transcript_11755/g.1807 Transcript_11755/m.1807 type:complete len:134 (-) Transcript_11755:20-421(-)